MDTIAAAEATVFEEPGTGRRVKIAEAAKDALFLGPYYFARHKVWKHAVIGAILAILTLGMSWLVYTVYAEKILRAHLLARGWIPVATTKRESDGNFVILLAANIWVVVIMVLLSYLSMIFPYPG